MTAGWDGGVIVSEGRAGLGASATSRAFDRRVIVLALALALAVAVQVGLAVAFGDANGARRDAWPVAITLWLSLTMSAGAIVFAVWCARDIKLNWISIIAIAFVGVAMRLPYFGTGPMLEDDHFRYLLDGALLADGFSPYALAPQQILSGATTVPAALIEAGRAQIAAINFPDLRSIYPGGAQALFAIAHWIKPWSIDGLRAIILCAELATALLVVRMLIGLGRPPLLATLYWCNPLMAFCLTGQAHIDAALAPAVLLALIATDRRAAALAGASLGFAAGVKLWPILLAPLVVRALLPDRWAAVRFAVVLALVVVVLCGPLMLARLNEGSGLAAYAGGWSINNAPYAWASYASYLLLGGDGVGERILRGSIVMLVAASSLLIALRRPVGLSELVVSASLLSALVFYLSPAQFPWYVVWCLPLAVIHGSFALATATVFMPVYFLFFPLAADGFRDWHSYGLAMLHIVPVAALAVLARWSAGSPQWFLPLSRGSSFRTKANP